MSKRITLKRLANAGLTHSRTLIRNQITQTLRPINISSANRPNEFLTQQVKIHNANKTLGQPILKGHFAFADERIDVGAQGDPWTIALPSQRFAGWLHSFNWLPHLLAVPEKSAALHARLLVDRWIAVYGQFNVFAWHPEHITERLYHWLALWAPAMSADSKNEIAQKRRNSVLKQLKFLRQSYPHMDNSLPRLHAAITLSMGGARLMEKAEDYLALGLDWLDDEVEAQILPDGGHISRSPEITFQVFRRLQTLATLLKARGIACSNIMERALNRLAHMVAFFQLSDNALAIFNGGGEENANCIKKALKAHTKPTKSFGYCPHMKYQRISHEGTVLIVDTGGPPPPGFDTHAHLAPLAFNLATPAGRLIVNCGWSEEQPYHWKQAVRATAAHSTLTLNAQSAGHIVDSGLPQKWLGHAIETGAQNVKAFRKEQSKGVWLETSHDGYRDLTGLMHNRRLYMSLDGTDLRGEDSLAVPLGAVPLSREKIPFTLRFHLHPSVKVTLAQDHKSALLIQPGNEGWRFRTDVGPLTLEPSFYLGSGTKPIKSEQIVISGAAFADGDGEAQSNRVRWSFKRMESRA
ncbi:MAG: heparinase II/III family protein [Maricaulaceae bacterium]